MKLAKQSFSKSVKLLAIVILLCTMGSAFCQVSPEEIMDPRAKAAEGKYLNQLQSMHQLIDVATFPSSFKLARYLKARPSQREASNSDGIEFVNYQSMVVLKVSGVYKKTFNTAQISKNQRASQTFQEVVVPILQIVTLQMPKTSDYNNVGFEIIYGIRDDSKEFGLEGREVLTVVLSREDALAYKHTLAIAERQRILNRSDIFVNGESYGLALNQRDPLVVEALDRSAPRQAGDSYAPATSSNDHVDTVSGATVSPAVSITQPATASQSPATFADAIRLQTQLNAVAKEDGARLHLEAKTPPSFELAGDQTLLHFTLQNSMAFDRNTTSIYKRAALSFDLFLAPELRSLSRRLPDDQQYDTLEFSVLDHSAADRASPETIDYICPLASLRSFVANKITTQDLINQSVVLVNGVRIAVNLQMVE